MVSVMPIEQAVRQTRKVMAYVTHEKRLLVFAHPDFPEAGIQVPAGTVEPGEDPDRAVMREAFEETGLTCLELVRFLGERNYEMSDFGRNEIQHRRFYHLTCTERPQERWQHAETSGGKHEAIMFDFFWTVFPDDVPDLIAGHGDMLPELVSSLEIMA